MCLRQHVMLPGTFLDALEDQAFEAIPSMGRKK